MKENLKSWHQKAQPYLDKLQPYAEKAKPYALKAAYYGTLAGQQSLNVCILASAYLIAGCQKAAEQCGTWNEALRVQTQAPSSAAMIAPSTPTSTTETNHTTHTTLRKRRESTGEGYNSDTSSEHPRHG